MTRVARAFGRTIVWVGLGFVALGLVAIGAGVYVGSWPVRRVARRAPAIARMAALQEALLAAGALLGAFRSSSFGADPPA